MWKPIILDVECIVCNKSLQKINHDPAVVSRNMGKIAHRRSRTPNWSAEEKKCLLELIKDRRIVITKTTNGPNHYEEKDVAWNEILRELAKRFGDKFNDSPIKKVKTQWQNMKRIAREEVTLNGPETKKYTKQSLQVCNILGLVKDGVLINTENANLNETAAPTVSNIEIKTERIEDDKNQPGCSSENTMEVDVLKRPEPSENSAQSNFELSSSFSEPNSESQEFESPEQETTHKKSVSANTELSFLEDIIPNVNPLQNNLKDFVRYSAAERQIKMESLKEERHVMRAMRETAELNKIIAEQKLKHVLWVKKREMAMYSGEPGSGAGKGGGGGGAIRDAGGAFGKMEAAREDQYFYNKQKEQLSSLKGHLDKEILFHQEQIKRHEDAIRRHKQQMTEMDKK